MKKAIALILTLVFLLASVCVLAACGGNEAEPDEGSSADAPANKDSYVIAVPNDPSNEARALRILESLGFIKLKDGVGLTATKLDVAENPLNIEIKEIEAAQIPNFLPDVDFAVINSNYAIDAGLSPAKDALALEGAYSAYSNILAVKKGNEEAPLIKALVAALSSKQVADFIEQKYGKDVLSVVEEPGDGYDADLDYAPLAGQTISVAASPTPHAEILEEAKKILAEKDITLDIRVYTDYVQPNLVVDAGELDANYFQHVPYLDSFNEENGTDLVSVLAVHVEPMGVYAGKTAALPEVK
ncbi:MAG: hypothetical protein IK104_04230 [Clostridia bacterium]|nr:hypothetical protein [Clostridia bacterium]